MCADTAISASTAQLSTSQMFVQLMQMIQKMEQGLLSRMDKIELRLTAVDEKLAARYG